MTFKIFIFFKISPAAFGQPTGEPAQGLQANASYIFIFYIHDFANLFEIIRNVKHKVLFLQRI
jgi:hypothetical protein